MLFQNQCLSIELPDGGKTKFNIEGNEDTKLFTLQMSWPRNSQLGQGGLLMTWDRNLQGEYSLFQGCKTGTLELVPFRQEFDNSRRIVDRTEYRVLGRYPYWVGSYSEIAGANSQLTDFEIYNDTDSKVVSRLYIGFPGRLAEAETKLIALLESLTIYDPDQWE